MILIFILELGGYILSSSLPLRLSFIIIILTFLNLFKRSLTNDTPQWFLKVCFGTPVNRIVVIILHLDKENRQYLRSHIKLCKLYAHTSNHISILISVMCGSVPLTVLCVNTPIIFYPHISFYKEKITTLTAFTTLAKGAILLLKVHGSSNTIKYII